MLLPDIASGTEFPLVVKFDMCKALEVNFFFEGNTKLGMIPSLSIHPDAAQDLRGLMKSDPKAAGMVLALLEQAKHDSTVLDSLLDHDFGVSRTEDYHVSKWWALWKSGYNIWRLKIWTVPRGSLKQRIVYAYDPTQLQHHVLAVVHRDFDYERDHAVTNRILQAYRDLGIARY